MSTPDSRVPTGWRQLCLRILLASSLLWPTASVRAIEAPASDSGPVDIVILLDNSSSMRTHDPDFRLRALIPDFAGGLPPGSRAAVMLYDRGITPVHPLEPADRTSLASALAKLDYSGEYSNAASATERAIYELGRQPRKDAGRSIVLLIDGPIDTGNPERDFDYSRWLREILSAEAAQAGIRIYGIALSEDADIQIVQTLAHTTGGDYLRTAGVETLHDSLKSIGVALGSDPAEPARPSTPTAEVPPPPQPPHSMETPSDDTARAEDPGEVDGAAPAEAVSGIGERTQTPVQADTGEPAPAPLTGEAGVIGAAPEATGPGDANSLIDGRTGPAARALDWSKANPVPIIVALALLLAGLLTLLMKRRTRQDTDSPAAEAPPAQSAFTPPCMLEDLGGASRRQNYDITGKLTWISRAPGDESGNARTIVIRDDLISRDHAVIEYRNFGYWISDRGSVNGTWVNGERLVEERRLKNGDRIRFATFEFLCSLPQRDDMDETVMAATGSSVSSVAPSPEPEQAKPRVVPPARPPAPDATVVVNSPAHPPPPGPASQNRSAPDAEVSDADVEPAAGKPNLFARTDTQEQPATPAAEDEIRPRTEQIPVVPDAAESNPPADADEESQHRSTNGDDTVLAEALKPAERSDQEAGEKTVVRPRRDD